MWDWTHGWGWHMGGFGMIIWIVVLIVVIWLIIRLVTRNDATAGRGTQHTLPENESPLDVLQKRYARGEITREQYLDMKKDLES